MKEEPFYALKNSVDDPFNYGNFKYEVFDAAENKLLYSRGFDPFQEWQQQPKQGYERSFYEVATMPFPKNKIRFVISARERKGTFTNSMKQRLIRQINSSGKRSLSLQK